MSTARFSLLITRFRSGQLTEQESDELLEMVNDGSYDDQLQEDMLGALQQMETSSLWTPEKQEALLAAIHRRKARPVVYYLKRLSVADAVILVAGAVWFLLPQEKQPLSQAQRLENHFTPGTTGAVLSLSNGQTIVLDTARNGKLLEGFSKGAEGLTITAKKGNETIAYVSVTTPNGRTQSVVLDDGTEVWLNAGSSIRFPVRFSGDKREVSITGEVYFEVARNERQHFFVQTPGDRIEVKGTHFNINAYDPAKIQTTLLEGSVQVVHQGRQQLLQPGEQFDGAVVSEPDLQDVMAWKNGLFRFSDANIRQIMAEVGRWYDVQVEFEGNVSDLNFSGGVPRTGNVSALLQKLELTKSVEFRIEGKTIYVKKIN